MRINNISPISYSNKQVNQAAPSFKAVNLGNIEHGKKLSIYNKIVDATAQKLSKGFEKIAGTNGFKKFINKFSSSDKYFAHLLVAESCFLSGFYMVNTLKNKKIKKEQKPQMLINDALTLGVSTAGAYFAENKIGNAVKAASEKYFAKNSSFYTNLGKKAQEAMITTPKKELLDKVGETAKKTGEEFSAGIKEITSMIGNHLSNIVSDESKFKAFKISSEKLQKIQKTVVEDIYSNSGNAEKAKEVVSGVIDDIYNSSAARVEADKISRGIGALKTIVIFGIIYRYLGPVIITPIANKLSSKFFSEKKEQNNVSDKK